MKKTLIAIILALALVLTFATSVAFAGDEVLALKGAPYVATTDTKLEKTDDVYYTNNSENGFAYVLPTEGAEGYVVTYSTEKEGTYNSYDGSAIKTEGTYYFKESKEGQSSDIVTVVVDYTAPVFTDFETFVATNWANLKLDVKDKFVAPQYTAEEGVTVYVEYAKNGSSIKDGWTEVAQDKEINITLGYYAFRYVLKDKAGNETPSDESITVYVTDTLVPTVDASDLANEKVEEGSTYTVQKPDITDHSSYTSYYTVSKDGTVIYNSDSGEIAEGYEAMFATSGSIVTAKGDAGKTLVITYYVTDANGNKAEPVSYNLSITEKEETETQKAVHVWQYIFFGLAIVAFIGIILVIVIKPKQNDAPTGGRVHYAKEPKAEEPQAKEPAQEETPVEEPAEEPVPVEEPAETPVEEAPAEEEPQAEEVPAEETPAEEPQAEEPKTEE